MKLSRISLCILICLLGIWPLISSCKKPATVDYGTVTLRIALVDYNFAPYTSGSWSTGTKIRIKYDGAVLDSLTSLYGAFNLPTSTLITDACAAPLNTITHTFRIRSNVLNDVEFSDQTGIRASYTVIPTAIYFQFVSDSTTSNLPNTNCHLSVFPVR